MSAPKRRRLVSYSDSDSSSESITVPTEIMDTSIMDITATSDLNFSGFGERFSSTRRLDNFLPPSTRTAEFNVSSITDEHRDVDTSTVMSSDDIASEDISMPSVNAVGEVNAVDEVDDVETSNTGMHSGMNFSLVCTDRVLLPIVPSEERIVEDVVNSTLENEILAQTVFTQVPRQEPEHVEVPNFINFSLPVETLQGDLPSTHAFIMKGASKASKNGKTGPVLVTGQHAHTYTRNRWLKDGGATYACTKKQDKSVECKAKWHVSAACVNMLEEAEDTDTVDVIVDKDIIFVEGHNELCVPAVGIIEKILYIRECKAMAADPEHNFDDAMVIVEAAKRKYGISEAIKVHFPLDINVCKMINRVRKDIRAVAPKQDATDILTWEFITDHLPPKMRHFYRGDSTAVTKGERRRSFIFFTDQQKIGLKHVREAIVDGTFKVVDKPHYQLVSVHGTVPGAGPNGLVVNKNLPLAYIVMQGKSEADYTSAFQKLKSLVEDDGTPMEVNTFIVDFERAFWNAIRATWANVKVRGCWFHFNQCIYRKVQEFKIEYSFTKQFRTYKMIRRLMTMALIHPLHIPQLFGMLKKVYAAEINNPDFDGFQKLFAYFQDQWITGIFKPDDWSCHNKDIRTTNQVERWNGYIYVRGGKKKLNIHLLAQLLGKDAVYAMSKMDEYSDKVYRKRAQVEKEEAITNAYADFEIDNNSWNLLDKLLKATTKQCRWTIDSTNTSDTATENV